MKRCLIIIGNEGTPENFLPGVKSDVDNYLSFFKSDNGGAWEDDEIISEGVWSKDILQRRIFSKRMDGLDYALIVFAGHGYGEKDGDIYFELSPNNEISLKEIKSFFPTQKVMMIADSCQSYLTEELRERSVLTDSHRAVGRREELKKKYNQKIEAVCKNAFTFVSAVSLGESAKENSQGGLYSRSLLARAKNIADDSVYKSNDVVDINKIHTIAMQDVKKESNDKQHPYISISRGDVYPPFYVK